MLEYLSYVINKWIAAILSEKEEPSAPTEVPGVVVMKEPLVAVKEKLLMKRAASAASVTSLTSPTYNSLSRMFMDTFPDVYTKYDPKAACMRFEISYFDLASIVDLKLSHKDRTAAFKTLMIPKVEKCVQVFMESFGGPGPYRSSFQHEGVVFFHCYDKAAIQVRLYRCEEQSAELARLL